jgi:hypothetical protein
LGRRTKVAIENGWELNANYDPTDNEIISHIAAGFNYGIMPINGLVVIDCDTEKLYDNLPQKWKSTLTTITGRDSEIGRHVFLHCIDESPPIKTVIKDPIIETSLGDIRGSGSPAYTVGAGSIHPDTGKQYTYFDIAAPLVDVTWEEIKKHLIDTHLIHFKKTIPNTTKNDHESLCNQLNLHIENFTMPNNPQRRGNGDIQGSHPIHGSTTGMNFSINTSKNVWHCYRDNVGGDPIAWIAYAHCNIREEYCNCLSSDEFIEVKDWLYANGYSSEIDALDVAYQTSTEPEADISEILAPRQSLSIGTCETDEEITIRINKEMDDARARGLLPDFPELKPGLFKDYVDFGKIVTYSIPEFHFAAALSIVSMAVGRKIKMQVGMTNAHPNIFAMVVGATTISGKSAACDMAVCLLSPLVLHEEELDMTSSVKIMRGTISEPALKQDLADTYNRLWYYDDCAGFFDTINDGWNKPMLGTLCAIYDGSPTEHTLSRTRDNQPRQWICPHPYVSILFNTTYHDIEQRASSNLFTSGFSPRVMWFIGQGGSPRKNVERTLDDIAMEKDIKRRVEIIKNALRTLNDDSIVFGVCDKIEQWRLDLTLAHLGREHETYRVAISRGFMHAYKIAALLSVTDPSIQERIFNCSSYPINLRIPDEHSEEAIRIVETYLMPRTLYVYGLCNQADDKNHQIKILKALEHFGGSADRTSILRKTHMNSKDVTISLKTLEESGEVKICKRPIDNSTKCSEIIIKL